MRTPGIGVVWIGAIGAACAEHRALLALSIGGAFRRPELVALEAADLAFEPDGLLVQIRRSKTDPDGQGQEIAIPQGIKLHPVRRCRPGFRRRGSRTE